VPIRRLPLSREILDEFDLSSESLDVKSCEVILDFLRGNPEFANAGRQAVVDLTIAEQHDQFCRKYFSARKKAVRFSVPKTVPDVVVSVILKAYFDFKDDALQTITQQHQWSMAAENMVGELAR
jgi:SinI restriction endonuclease